MTDPERLLLGEGTPEEQNLLAAGAAEEPPVDGKKRLVLALGLAATTFSSRATAENAQARSGALSKLLGSKLGLKAALVVGAGGALALSVLVLLARGPARFDTRTPATQEMRAPARSALSAPDGAPAVALEREPAAPAATTAPISIADEVVRLDAVRRALSAQDSAGALAFLAAYEHMYPRGALAPEAARLRVEAFLVQGDTRRAQALARAFLRAYPGSPHAATLRKIAERPRRAKAE